MIHVLPHHLIGVLSDGSLVDLIDWAPLDLFGGKCPCEAGHFRIPNRPCRGIE